MQLNVIWQKQVSNFGDEKFVVVLTAANFCSVWHSKADSRIQVLRDAGKGWLKSFLGVVMRRALALKDASRSEIEKISNEESPELVLSYRSEEFLKICAELVERVLYWKNVVDGVELGGIDPVTYLDINHADWRNDIPIHLPPAERDLANEILSGLLKEVAGRLASSGIGCEKFLVEVDGRWQPALHILVDGEFSAQKFDRFTPTNGRLHVFPAGPLAECIARCFALIEPPTSGVKTWRVRPVLRFSELLRPFPYNEDVQVDITSAGKPQRIIWPRGEAVRSSLLVFAPMPNNSAQNLETQACRPRFYALAARDFVRADAIRLVQSWW